MEYYEILTSATAFTGLTCPKCTSNSFRKHGRCLGIQRYRCNKCGRCFKETINTPLHGIHNKQKMICYAATLPSQLSIRKTASAIGISVSTSFSWRHKILSSFIPFKNIASNSPAGISQITVPYSYKGRRTIPEKPASTSQALLVADARGISCLHLLPAKSTSSKTAKLLTSCIKLDTAIACKPAKLLAHAARRIGNKTVQHQALKKKLIVKTQMVLAELEQWMERFRGVATKYLQQYWNWFRAKSSCTTDAFVLECLVQRELLRYRTIRNS